MLVLNLALWTGFVSWAVSGHHRMSSLKMHHGFAWVIWPTRVHVRSFSLTIDAYRYQLDLQIPDGTIDIELLALLSREVHATAVRGDDVSAVFRYKAPPGKVTDARRALFGPIEGLGEPVRAVGAPDLPSHGEAWSVDLEHIDGRFADLWVDELHFHDADVRIQGGLRTRSGDLFAVDGARVDVETAALSIDAQTVATGWSGSVELDVADYDPFSLQGKNVIGQLSGKAGLDAEVVDLAPVAAFASRPVRIHDGAGALHIGLSVRDGIVQPDTAIDYKTPSLGVAVAKWAGRGRFHASVHGQTQSRAALRGGVDLWSVSVRRSGSEAEPIALEHVSAFAISCTRDLTRTLQLDDGHAIASGVDLPDLSIFADDLEKAEPREGSVTARYELDVRGDRRLLHELDAEVRGARVVLGDTAASVAADLHASALTSRNLDQGHTTGFDLDVHDLTLDSPKGHSRRTWVKLHEDSELRWTPDGTVEGTLRGRLDDLRVVLAHASARKSLVERVPDLDVTKPLDFVLDVHRTAGSNTVEVRKLDRPGLQIEGVRRSRGDATRSAFRLERLRLGYTSREDGAHAVFVDTDDAWMERQADWVRAL